MSEKRRAGQQEAYLRASDRLAHGVRDPYEKKLLGRVISAVITEAQKGDGRVVFPEPLSDGQQHRLRQRLDEHYSGFAQKRVEFITTVPLEEGVGTMIGIRGKR